MQSRSLQRLVGVARSNGQSKPTGHKRQTQLLFLRGIACLHGLTHGNTGNPTQCQAKAHADNGTQVRCIIIQRRVALAAVQRTIVRSSEQQPANQELGRKGKGRLQVLFGDLDRCSFASILFGTFVRSTAIFVPFAILKRCFRGIAE